MINSLKNLLKVGSVFLITFMVTSCESDIDSLGSQFFDGNSAQGTEKSYSIVAYNVNNNDAIRADASKLGYATLGAFYENVFGGQKSDYITQVRLSSYNPDFGTNPVLDSAVLVVNPVYQTDSLTTTTTDITYPAVDGVAAKKEVTTYPVAKYGKYKINNVKTVLNLKVEEVSDFLGSTSDSIMSNKVVATSTLLGKKAFDGNITGVKITKKDDGSELLTRDVALRIKLDETFFTNKIIAKKGAPELADAASFIRYFKGIKISVDENDGYIFKIAPTNMSIQLYYKKDVVENNVTTRPQSVYELSLSTSNVHYNHITYDRTGTPYQSAMDNINAGTIANGQPQLFAQGMGGSSFGLKVKAETIDKLKALYNNDKIGIINAKIRLYTDTSIWKNSYAKPTYFMVSQKSASSFLADMSAYSYSGYSLIKTADLDKDLAYYDINITKTIKDIIETNAENKDLIVDLGSYLSDSSTGALLGLQYNDRPYTPNRIVLSGTAASNVGEEVNNSYVAQLKVTYASKK